MALERQKYRAMDHAAQLAKVTFFYINFNDMCVCVCISIKPAAPLRPVWIRIQWMMCTLATLPEYRKEIRSSN